jgi:hypothetical protein
VKAFQIVAVLSAIFLPAQETFSPDADGFIRNWLVLAPIATVFLNGSRTIVFA